MGSQYTESNSHKNAHEGAERSHTFANVGGKFLSVRVKGHICDPHFHDTYSIALVRKGEADCSIREQRRTVSSGDIMLINPYEIAYGGNEDSEFVYDVLYPSCELINDIMQITQEGCNFPSFQEAVIKNCKSVDDLFSAVDNYVSQPSGSQSDYIIETCLSQLLRDRSITYDEFGFTESNRNAILKACQLIRDSHRTPVDLSIIAEQVGLSRFYFIRLFQKYTKMTPSAYLRQVKLAEARRLILEGASLAGAAIEAGFADQAHMTRLFKQTFDFTPGQLKRGIQTSSDLNLSNKATKLH